MVTPMGRYEYVAVDDYSYTSDLNMVYPGGGYYASINATNATAASAILTQLQVNFPRNFSLTFPERQLDRL